jgi:hypothetical protein
MQLALYVQGDKGVIELNERLEEGWEVVETCAMPSSCCIAINTGVTATYNKSSNEIEPTCLVILTDGEK